MYGCISGDEHVHVNVSVHGGQTSASNSQKVELHVNVGAHGGQTAASNSQKVEL